MPRLYNRLVDKNCEEQERRRLARSTNVTVVVLGEEAREAENSFKEGAAQHDDECPKQNEKITEFQRIFHASHGLLADDVSHAGVVGELSKKLVVDGGGLPPYGKETDAGDQTEAAYDEESQAHDEGLRCG